MADYGALDGPANGVGGQKLAKAFDEESSLSSVRTPVTLTWENMSYSIPVRVGGCSFERKPKQILRTVSGSVQPGQLLAIIGATGAGKSSLLDVLAQRKNSKYVQGEILVNGRRPDNTFNRLSSYVTQDDCLQGLLTVRETLQFYADLQLESSVPKEERKQRVSDLIAELGLTRVADSRVGTQFRRGISGGEKKRLSIGASLITDPGVIFLDEPTTGLDAYNSFSVLQLLNDLCKKGRTIICTIHQPRSTIFELFDQLLVLSQGSTAYFGPAQEAVPYFSRLGFQCGQYINPADFCIDVTVECEAIALSKSEGSALLETRAMEAEQCVDLVAAYEKSEMAAKARKQLDECKQNGKNAPRPRKIGQYASNWFRQMWFLSQRMLKTLIRNPMTTYVQLAQTVLMASLVGLLYFDIGLCQNSIQNRVGALFFIMTNQAFSMMASLNVFLEERNLVNREKAAGCYRTSTYFFGKLFIELPLLLLYTTVFSCIAYWLVGLQPSWECFGGFVLTLLLFTSVASSLFLLLGALAPNIAVAQIICPVVLVVFMIFGGFFVNNDSIPVYFQWIAYVSFFNYGYEALCVIEFDGFGNPLQFPCTCDSDTACVITSGTQELELLGFGDGVVWQDWVILLSMAVIYRFCSYFCLRFLHKEKR